MIELSKHIEVLMLENDCVIIPGLGGFIAHNEPATYDAEEGIFYPPRRAIGFNPQLVMNDGLLAQYYMRVYQTNFSGANRIINNQVKKIRSILNTEGSIEFQGLGKICCNIHDKLEFHAEEKEILTPSYYPFSSFSFKELNAISSTNGKTIPFVPKERDVVEKGKRNLSWINHAVAAAVAVLLFLLFSAPVENTYMDKGNYASLTTNDLLSAIKSQSLAFNVIHPVNDHPKELKKQKDAESVQRADISSTERVIKEHIIQIEKEKEQVKETAEAHQEQALPSTVETTTVLSDKPLKYHIVIASLGSMKDAQATIASLESNRNLKNLKVKEGNGHFRIVYSSYADKDVANNALNELRLQELYQNAWLLVSK